MLGFDQLLLYSSPLGARLKEKFETAECKPKTAREMNSASIRLPRKVTIDERLAANNGFDRHFNQNRYSVSCSVCQSFLIRPFEMNCVPSKAVDLRKRQIHAP